MVEGNEILSGLDITTHAGWSEGMKRLVAHLADSDAIAEEHDMGPGGEGVPVMTNNESIVQVIEKRMKTYHDARSALLADLPRDVPETFTVSPDLIAELFTFGDEPIRESEGHDLNPVGVMAMHEAANRVAHLACNSSGVEVMDGSPARYSTTFYVHSRSGINEPEVAFRLRYAQGDDDWSVDQPTATLQEHLSGPVTTVQLPYLKVVELALDAAIDGLSSSQVWDRVGGLADGDANDHYQ